MGLPVEPNGLAQWPTLRDKLMDRITKLQNSNDDIRKERDRYKQRIGWWGQIDPNTGLMLIDVMKKEHDRFVIQNSQMSTLLHNYEREIEAVKDMHARQVEIAAGCSARYDALFQQVCQWLSPALAHQLRSLQASQPGATHASAMNAFRATTPSTSGLLPGGVRVATAAAALLRTSEMHFPHGPGDAGTTTPYIEVVGATLEAIDAASVRQPGRATTFGPNRIENIHPRNRPPLAELPTGRGIIQRSRTIRETIDLVGSDSEEDNIMARIIANRPSQANVPVPAPSRHPDSYVPLPRSENEAPVVRPQRAYAWLGANNHMTGNPSSILRASLAQTAVPATGALAAANAAAIRQLSTTDTTGNQATVGGDDGPAQEMEEVSDADDDSDDGELERLINAELDKECESDEE